MRPAPPQPPRCRQESFEAYTKKYGEDRPDPYAIYAYEAMRLALDAIERSQTGERADIIDALFPTSDRESVLGTYSIDENGDTFDADLIVSSRRPVSLRQDP